MAVKEHKHFTWRDVTHFRVKKKRMLGEGRHGVIQLAEIRFGNSPKKIVAAKRYKSAVEAVGEQAVLRQDTLNTRPLLVATNMFFKLKVGDPQAEEKVTRWRAMMKKIRLRGALSQKWILSNIKMNIGWFHQLL